MAEIVGFPGSRREMKHTNMAPVMKLIVAEVLCVLLTELQNGIYLQ